jgi:hypothetical protein
MDTVCKKHGAKSLEEAEQEIKQFQREYSDIIREFEFQQLQRLNKSLGAD